MRHPSKRNALTERFGITELQLVLGWSVGALQTYEWAVRFPDGETNGLDRRRAAALPVGHGDVLPEDGSPAFHATFDGRRLRGIVKQNWRAADASRQLAEKRQIAFAPKEQNLILGIARQHLEISVLVRLRARGEIIESELPVRGFPR